MVVTQQSSYQPWLAQLLYNLISTYQTFPQAPGGQDEQLAQAGFTVLLFNGVPFLVDSHITGAASTGVVFMIEDYCSLVSPRANFTMEDFQTPVNQDVMVAKLLWAGNLAFNNRARQGKFMPSQAKKGLVIIHA